MEKIIVDSSTSVFFVTRGRHRSKDRRQAADPVNSCADEVEDKDKMVDEEQEENGADAGSLCRTARTLWLTNATTRNDLLRIEHLYRRALNSKRTVVIVTNTKITATIDRASKQKKKRKGKTNKAKQRQEVAALSKIDYQKAAERLSLLYIQSGRSYKATLGLKYLKFECRLSERILNYPAAAAAAAATTTINTDTNYHRNNDDHRTDNNHSKKRKIINNRRTSKYNNKKKKNNTTNNEVVASSAPPCCVVDDFLSIKELEHLQRVFGATSSSYWKDHNYIIDQEPPAPYFSYVIALNKSNNTKNYKKNKSKEEKKPQQQQGRSFFQKLIHKILEDGSVSDKFPTLRNDVRYVEIWAHNRPHASGHQLHFDSDDEGRSDIPKHPIVSTVLYLSTNTNTNATAPNDKNNNNNNTEMETKKTKTNNLMMVGGPTLVTNQRLRDPATTNLNSVRGWLVPSYPSRMVCFDGSVLHGVIPGKGVIPTIANTNIDTNNKLDQEPQQKQPRPRRVTLMMAFWKDIKIRPGKKPGSARPWPVAPAPLPSWTIELNRTDIINESDNDSESNGNLDLDDTDTNRYDDEHNNNNAKQCRPQQQQQIIPIRYVYENFDGTPVPKYDGNNELYMPEYDRVFQGF